MPSSDRLGPVAMRRIALVAPRPALRALLVHVAAAGVVEVETAAATDGPPGPGDPRPAAAGHGGSDATADARRCPTWTGWSARDGWT